MFIQDQKHHADDLAKLRSLGQGTLFENDEIPYISSSTFLDNLSLPVHRWFRYSAGFSASWIRRLIQREKDNGRTTILDPFVGSGTVLLESEFCDTKSIGIEAHPFVAKIAQTKLLWREDPIAFRDFAFSILEKAENSREIKKQHSKLIEKCFPQLTLQKLDLLLNAWSIKNDDSPLSELSWLALVSILRECSPVGTAQWQYVLPNKTKKNTADPFQAYRLKIRLMSQDMNIRHQQISHENVEAVVTRDDARYCSSIRDNWADLVVTSPPYANNFDYADATRLEMSFLGDISGWGDLQDVVRKYLVRSCTQHVAKCIGETYTIIEDPLLKPIYSEINKACQLLERERENHGGKKPYHTMIAAYFSDMAKVWKTLRRVTHGSSLICFIVGDSAPYGIHVPIERWFGEIAVSLGFESFRFEKLRDRNVKWKNRKHRIPLHEGILWVHG